MAISNFVSRCLHDQPPVIYGGGSQTRDFTYIDEILLTGDHEYRSIDNIEIKPLANLLPNSDLSTERNDQMLNIPMRTSPRRMELLGYELTTTIRQGGSKFIDWYQANED